MLYSCKEEPIGNEDSGVCSTKREKGCGFSIETKRPPLLALHGPVAKTFHEFSLVHLSTRGLRFFVTLPYLKMGLLEGLSAILRKVEICTVSNGNCLFL